MQLRTSDNETVMCHLDEHVFSIKYKVIHYTFTGKDKSLWIQYDLGKKSFAECFNEVTILILYILYK